MNVPPTEHAFPLSMASENSALRIVALHGGYGLARRIGEMGLTVGSEIKVCQREGGALVIARGETRFAIGAGLAHKVMVVPL